MNKQLGAEFESQILREAFLKDNCDNVEEKGYMKPFTQEELQTYKETLANISIFKGTPAEQLEVETYAQINGRDVFFTLLSPGANQSLEELRNSVIDNQLSQIQEIAPNIAIIEE